MRYLALLVAVGLAAQTDVLSQAYAELRARRYDTAIALFRQAIEATPANATIHKDLAYTLLKAGETEAARDEFAAAMELDPRDYHSALEYAFLCHETKQIAQARRVFDRVRKAGDAVSRATADEAFTNVDGALKAGIERWRHAIELSPDNFSAHQELASLAEQRDELALAAAHYEMAWKLKPAMRSLLLDLGRVWKSAGDAERAGAALLAASRCDEARVAETARERLPARYPYVYEFQRALALDAVNAGLRRELGYLLLEMGRRSEAEIEFGTLAEISPDDLHAAAQLGFLRLSRNDVAGAMPLLERVLRSDDEELAARVRVALKLPAVPRRRAEAPRNDPGLAQVKALAARSFEAGYMKDALKYFRQAHEADPVDFHVMLRMGWTYNILRQDEEAMRWFDRARRSSDPLVAAEAKRAYSNLRPNFARVRTTAWLFPVYSTRWRDLFSYGQIKTEFRIGGLGLRPYVSTRFVGDTRGDTRDGLAPTQLQPQYLSESSFIFGLGLATSQWRGLMAWGEAGSATSYREQRNRIKPDYRGGVSFGKGWGRQLGSESSGVFFTVTADAVFVSRFANDVIGYGHNRFGYTLGRALQAQLYWNYNLTTDSRRQAWANFYETGPGLRFRWRGLPRSVLFSVDYLRGVYTRGKPSGPIGPIFSDLRIGFWYAITH